MTAEIFAIFFGPIIAVGITLWWQNRKEKRDAKLRLFTTLMAHRKSMPPSYDFVAALNLIDVVFANHERVVHLWHELYTLFQNPMASETQNHKYIELLSEMASVLGYRKLKQTDIDKFYYPRGHADALNAQIEWQTEWLRVLKNLIIFWWCHGHLKNGHQRNPLNGVDPSPVCHRQLGQIGRFLSNSSLASRRESLEVRGFEPLAFSLRTRRSTS
jgi:Family of unknown function (DUF6680)